MDITGILKLKKDEQVISEKFKKRDFVITDNSSQYPQHISFQLTQDKCGLIDQYNVGDEMTVHFNLRGKEWVSPTGEIRYFNSLEAWRIGAGIVATPEYKTEETKVETISVDKFTQQDEEDLPF